MMTSPLRSIFLVGALATALVGCGDDDGLSVPDTYAFDSRFDDGTSSVSHGGQVFRHVLIADLAIHIERLTSAIDDTTDYDMAGDGDIVATLDYFLEFDSVVSGDNAIRLTTGTLPTQQAVYDDIGSGKNLLEKLAGNDTATDHRDWSTEFTGWSDASLLAPMSDVGTPTSLVRAFFETIEDNALDRIATGGTRFAPDGITLLPVHITEDGLDLIELVEKVLLMSVAYSQGTDDYLDDDVDGKGLLADNTEPDAPGAPFTALEHAWDEAFGYFGAAHAFGDHDAATWAAQPYQDADGNGAIDLLSEHAFGHAIFAAKRDAGATAATDFSGDAFEAFLAGRALISRAGGALSASQQAELAGYRDAAVLAWERATVATMVHYVNELLVDMGAMGSVQYDFLEHAHHFSELKGLAIGLQFNPRSQLTTAQFTELHGLIGDSPVLESASPSELAAYRDDLLAARALLAGAYGFDPANLGDDDGLGGW